MRRRGGRTSHEEHDRSSSRQARSAATDGAPPAARGRRPIRRRRFGFEAMDRPRLEGDRQDVDPPGCVGATSPNVHPVVACSAMDGRTPRCLSGSGRPDRGMRASPAWDRSPPFLRRGCGDCRAADRSPSRRRPDACRQAPGLRLHQRCRNRGSDQEPSAAGRMVPTTGGVDPCSLDAICSATSRR